MFARSKRALAGPPRSESQRPPLRRRRSRSSSSCCTTPGRCCTTARKTSGWCRTRTWRGCRAGGSCHGAPSSVAGQGRHAQAVCEQGFCWVSSAVALLARPESACCTAKLVQRICMPGTQPTTITTKRFCFPDAPCRRCTPRGPRQSSMPCSRRRCPARRRRSSRRAWPWG